HPVERPAFVEAQDGAAVLAGMEAHLHLVPVAEDRRCPADREHQGLPRAADAGEGLAHLPLLGGALRGVVEVLKPAAAAPAEVRARRRDPLGRWALDPLEAGLGIAALDPGDTDLEVVPGEAAVDENDPPRVP